MEKSPSPTSSIFSPTSPLGSIYSRFDEWRTSLGLPNPGTMENLGREVKAVHLNNLFFDGGRAEIQKSLSLNPAFQVSHSFSMGSQGNMMGGAGGGGGGMYNFTGIYATSKVFMHGSIDQSGALQGRFNLGWSANDITKFQAQVTGSPMNPSMLQIEHDHHGSDYVLSLKSYNPSPADLTGIYVASYLQSITKNVALGLECIYQRPAPQVEEAGMSYALKYTGSEKDWIATLQLQASQGLIQSTYWQKISEKVEAAADLTLVPALMPSERKSLATVGVKYDFRSATFRGQVDSQGRVSSLLEHRLSPVFAILFSGQIDHFNNTSKFGIGIQLESSPLTEDDFARAQSKPAPVPPM